ncbi:MAG: M3 family metallopeptidase, partial [Muribaculaceae bacterium]|nr:M3 family metallopeptidase [Muribaculaceae bacterium]
MKTFKLALAALCCLAAIPPAMAQERKNPFLSPYENEYQIPPFDQIQVSDFIPAIKAGIKQQQENIRSIVVKRSVPDFDNTILPLENISPILDRVAQVFYHYDGALSTDEFAQMAEEAIPLLNEAANQINLDPMLFDRVKAVYDRRNEMGLNPVQIRVVEKYYRQFAEQGAALPEDKKKELIKVNDELSKLFIQYNKNLLNATNNFFVTVYDEADLAGLPESSVAMAADEAKARGLDGLWVFTLHAPSRLPVLQNADNRGLREAIYKGYTTLASYGDNNNYPVIEQIIKLRAEKAKIMGFDNFAQMMTSRVMAGTPEAATNLLLQVFEPAVKRSHEEVADMQAIVDEEGGNFKIAPWDYYYYADKVKKKKFDLDESEVRPYFTLDNVLNGLFTAAEKLYGIKMVEIPDAPKWMDEVTVYNVVDSKTGEHVAIFMTDYFPRSTKRQGAWMEQMQSSGLYEDGPRRPIVYNIGNFTRPAGDTPALLTIDEVETTFHEFGHALQSMLSQAPYRSIAGTNVDRDYVELSSQFNEHWAFAPELLKVYAKHYKTGETIPDDLIEKLNNSSKFNQGFVTTELAGAALLDLEWGKNDGQNVDVPAFEAAVAEKIGMPEEITFRYRSPYFKHIFGDDGYASGYYTYLWSQVLEADAFELFEQNGIFDPETAAKFKATILETGDTEDPMVLFERFRGHK